MNLEKEIAVKTNSIFMAEVHGPSHTLPNCSETSRLPVVISVLAMQSLEEKCHLASFIENAWILLHTEVLWSLLFSCIWIKMH